MKVVGYNCYYTSSYSTAVAVRTNFSVDIARIPKFIGTIRFVIVVISECYLKMRNQRSRMRI
jgi:hypothetical protein